LDLIIIPIVFLAPVIGFVAGFLAGIVRRSSVRIAAALIVIISPLALLSLPLLLPATSPSQRLGAAWLLTMLAAHVALWMLFALLGLWVGAARRRGSE
jgi:hypothetical protein